MHLQAPRAFSALLLGCPFASSNLECQPGPLARPQKAYSGSLDLASWWFRINSGGNLSHELLSVNSLAAVERCQALVDPVAEVGELSGTNPVVLLQQAERLAHHLAGGVVPASLHFLMNQTFQLGSQMNVHGLMGPQ